MEELNRPDVDSFKNQTKIPLVIVLDNVRSMHNVGSAFRTADGFAIEKIILCGITGTPPHREIEKTALGATQSVSWSHVEDTQTALAQLKAEGYQLIAIEQAAQSTFLQEYTVDPAAKYALIFGNEVHGVDESIMQQVDSCIEIPQFGTKHSFNVSVTIGIVLWDFVRKMKF